MPDLWGDQPPATVAGPCPSQQAGEVKSQRWGFAEPAVWTPRMLRTLERGIEGGRWFRLMDKVFAERTLRSAFTDVRRNDGSAGVDGHCVSAFEAHEQNEVAKLSAELKSGTYRPLSLRRVYIPKPGSEEKRPLSIPAVRDRVVQGALKAVIEPIFENEFAEQSYGFRPGRGCKDALRRVEELLKGGYTHVVDADLKSFFDTIPHGPLMAQMREHIADGRVLDLIESFLKAGILDGMKEWTPESGTPQGGVVSPLLANVYLNPLDHEMVQAGWQMVRYADELPALLRDEFGRLSRCARLVVLCRSEEEAQAALEQVERWVKAAGLTLHPQKTRIVDMRERGGFDFLGYHFERGMRWPRSKSMQKLRDRIRELTPRLCGHSLGRVIERLNQTLRGWYGYFRHSKSTTFTPVDGFVRGRLRTILRQRAKRRGKARGADHQRYPNAYFDAVGLFNLMKTWTVERQSHS
jgi:RNA-directed DNA polymerase